MPGTFAARTLATFLMLDQSGYGWSGSQPKTRPFYRAVFRNLKASDQPVFFHPQQMLMPLSYEVFLPADHGWMVLGDIRDPDALTQVASACASARARHRGNWSNWPTERR